MTTALIVVDVQKDFCPGGSLAIPEGDEVVSTINKEIYYPRRYDYIYASRDWHPEETEHFDKWPKHCVQDTEGAEFHDHLLLPLDTRVVTKGNSTKDDGYSAFSGTVDLTDGVSLVDDLVDKHVQFITVVGLATDFCVRATVLDALRLGFDVKVLTEGVRGLDGSEEALAEMQEAGAQIV